MEDKFFVMEKNIFFAIKEKNIPLKNDIKRYKITAAEFDKNSGRYYNFNYGKACETDNERKIHMSCGGADFVRRVGVFDA